MANKAKRLIIIALVVMLSSAWYFLAPAFMGERAGYFITTPEEPAVIVAAAGRRVIRGEPIGGPASDPLTRGYLVSTEIADRRLATSPAGPGRCRSWRQPVSGSAAIEAVACP